ncbi:MAG: NAD(P)H-hydrate dehydratase [Ruminococcaceae bacterium]|nr:NAD(P)H-hydrate dehydratase [Oscillospiraceae bacterium]
MEKIVSSRVMRESDEYTCKNVTGSVELMYRAGEGIYRSHNAWGKTAIVCGSGNNAGDGFVVAMLLHENGGDATVFLLSEKFSESGKYYFDMCVKMGIKTEKCTEETDFSGFDTILDCIFGTGFHGEARGLAAVIINKINESNAYVVSADINSGLSADSGTGAKCVRSDLTVSVGSFKYGHFLGMAKDVMHEKKNIDIGIEIRGEYAILAEKEDFLPYIKPRVNNSNKGTYGYVGIMGGCREYSGAAKLAGLGASALRSGCGVAKIIIPESIATAVAPYVLEETLLPLADQAGHMLFDKIAIDSALTGLSALSIGMGWGKSEENAKILEYILSEKALTLIIDADGLNTLAHMDKSLLTNTACRVVLTPHPKEFERISNVPTAEISENPVEYAKTFARKYGVILLLKGTSTVVTDGDLTYICDRGSAGMATAGSGDVLSGVLSGLFGYMEYSPRTVALGAYLAGMAGELAAEEYTPIAMTAGDTARMLPKVWKEWIS